MSLFPNIGVAGHGVHEGLDPNKGALQRVIANNLFQESDRGASFRRKLASVLERVRTPVLMPRLQRGDRDVFYPLSVVVKDVDLQFITASPAAHVPRHVQLRHNEVYQEMEGRDEPFPMLKVDARDVPESFLAPCRRGQR